MQEGNDSLIANLVLILVLDLHPHGVADIVGGLKKRFI
jgi:hypothetical protein